MSATTSSEAARGAAALAAAFARCRDERRAALVPYVTAGHPSLAATPDVLLALADAGADVIELGVPFSDPLADGPTIQRSSHEAIRAGADLAWTLRTLEAFRRERDVPVVLFTYLNPLLRHGVDRFLADAEAAGADGVLLTDLPVGADPELEARLAASPLARIPLAAPTTPPERLRRVAEAAEGFLYYVSRTGVTGARTELAAGLEREVAALRAVSPVPVAVGFGISTPEQAARVAAVADGVVVGSALVDALGREGVEGAGRLARSLRAAMERGGEEGAE